MDQCSRHVIPPVVGGPPHRPTSARSNNRAGGPGDASADLPAAQPQPPGLDPFGGGPPLGDGPSAVIGPRRTLGEAKVFVERAVPRNVGIGGERDGSTAGFQRPPPYSVDEC